MKTHFNITRGLFTGIGAFENGAEFSPCRKYRYTLWRIWDDTKPFVMFIGLNPSTANETKLDNTIRSVSRISKFNNYGGFYMVNCWAYVATDPCDLKHDPMFDEWNNNKLSITAGKCKDVVFAWGNFNIVKDNGRDAELKVMFPNAKAIGFNKNGSPKHPLFQKGESFLVEYNQLNQNQ